MRTYINVIAESAVMSTDIVIAEFDRAMREWAANQYRDYNAYGDAEQWLTTFSAIAAIDLRPEYDVETGVLTVDWYTSDGQALVWAAGHEEERLYGDSLTEQIEHILDMLEEQISDVERALDFDGKSAPCVCVAHEANGQPFIALNGEKQMTTDELVAEMGW